MQSFEAVLYGNCTLAAVYKRFWRITSHVKGDHIYQSRPKINSNFNCEVEQENAYSKHAILVSKKLQKEKVIVGHVPDALAAELFQMLKDKTLEMNCSITGKSRPAREGTWNQSGGIEIPCRY